MQADFWHEMWASGEVGFHQKQVNAFLQAFWPTLQLQGDEEILVPLCGKTLDMLWLREAGHSVIGVELSPKALNEFLQENHLQAQPTNHEKFCGYELPELKLLCGDFFHLSVQDCREVRAVFDRAAIIALPPKMRERYAKHLQEILPAGCKILMVIMEYEQSQMAGPPFSVCEAEVKALFAGFEVEKLTDVEFMRKGNPVTEKVLLLSPR